MKISTNELIIGILAILAGIAILIRPSILVWIVGIFLIVYGILVLTGKR